MGNGSSSLFEISIDFEQSHLFFPTIVMWILLLLLAVIFIVYGIPFIRAVGRREKTLSFSLKHFDKLRFVGTIILTIAYFLSMDYVGTFFPNMGLGFLLMSIPFMFLLSLLYVHNLDRKKFLLISLNSTISPGVAWYVLANIFNISLP
jgi:tellurite resistance protein TehA-like permease